MDALLLPFRNDFDLKEPTLCFLSPVLESIVSEKRVSLLQGSAIEFKVDFPSELYSAAVELSPMEFSRMLSNLISNALEAIHPSPQGTVTIRVSSECMSHEERICLEIEDSGKGMSKELMEDLQTAPKSFGKSEGHGLGLRHARALVAQMNGTFQMSSTLGVGTQVTLCLPKANSPEWLLPQISWGREKTIVIVEDCPSVSLLWQERLKGFKIILISNPESFDPNQFADDSYRFIFDYQFEGSSRTGVDLLRSISQPSRAIIATTYYNQIAIQEEVLNLGSKLLPKWMISKITIDDASEITLDKSRPDLVLIDDDSFIHKMWDAGAQLRGLRFMGVEDPDQLDESTLSKETPIFVDQNLSQGRSGLDLARSLSEKGYRNLYLTTGDIRYSNTTWPFLRGVVNKDFPKGF